MEEDLIKADSKQKNIDELLTSYKHCTEAKKKRLLHLKIVEMGLDLVKKIAITSAMQSSSQTEDLIQVGAVGLIKAIDFFEEEKNVKFSTYANYFIRGEIKHYLRDKANLIKTPRKMQEILFKIYSAKKVLKTQGIPEPSPAQIAEIINIPVEKVEEGLEIDKYKTTISLDQTVSADNEEIPLLEKIPAGDYQENISLHENKLMIEYAIKKLPIELREIVELSFFEELNQREISEKLNLSQMQVSRRLKKALNKLYNLIYKN